MIQTKTVETEKDVEICDVCGGEVGVLQQTHKKEGFHFCFSCYTIGWAVGELVHGKEYLSEKHYQRNTYRFDQDKLIKVLLEEAKNQLENGKY